MSRPRAIVALLVVFLAASAIAAFPWIRRWSRRSELERAAPDFCACMLGRRTGDVPRALEGIELATAIDETADRAWPKRCAPYAKRAVDATEAAWRVGVADVPDESWGDVEAELGRGNAEFATRLLEALQHFWTGDPAPDVPIAPKGVFPIVDEHTRAFIDVRASRIEVEIDRHQALLHFGKTCHVDPDGHADCPLERSGIRDASPIDADPNAADVYWDGTTRQVLRRDRSIVTTLPPRDSLHGVDWSHSFSNGHVVLLESSTLWDWYAGTLTKSAVAVGVYGTSTHFMDGWMIWKDLPPFSEDPKKQDAHVMVIDLAEGAKAKPQSLGTIAKVLGYFGSTRTYAVCRADSVFVDMDPKLAILRDGAWTMIDLPAAVNGRHIDCAGDTAIVTEFAPPEVRRCTMKGCATIPLPPVAGNDEDEWASDGVTLYHLEPRDPAWLLAIQPIEGGPRRIVPLARAEDVNRMYTRGLDTGTIHLFHGRLLVTLVRKSDGRPIVLSVERDGTTHVIVAGE